MKNKIYIIGILLLLMLPVIFPLSNSMNASPEAPQGPWVDEIDFFAEKEPAKVVDMIEKNDMQIYLSDLADPDLFQKIRTSPVMDYKVSYGLYFELTFNPVGPEFQTGELNPFSDPKIREAMNWLVDRNYIVEEIMKGLAKPKLTPFVSAFPEYGRMAVKAKLLEAYYSYNFDKAKTVIFREMSKLGAEYKEGKWYYKGKPVVLKFLIRTEDQRKQIGDYVSSQLEKLGFTVDRLYKTSREASPLWLFGDPAAGQWHIYTGGWITTAVSRDDRDAYAFFYTDLGIPVPLWQAYKPDPIFYEIAKKLMEGDFKDMKERQELMEKGLEYALKDSVRVWLVDQISPWVTRKEIDVAADLSGGFATYMWPRTIRYRDKVGGVVKAGSREVLVDPWNPVAGTNWLYDAIILQCLNDLDALINPYTGLPMPNRFINATVIVEKGIKVTKSSDWVTLKYADKIEVPTDAWFGWNTTTKKSVTTPPGTYAKVKVIVNYGDPIGHVKYHDGSVMSLADWFALSPFGFERVDPRSPFYDKAAEPGFPSFRKRFRGRRIISVHPLVIEYYLNYTHSEAEFIATTAAGWPNIPWHVTAIGIFAEEKGLLSFSSDKAKEKGNEWMNYIGGPSLPILSDMLDEALKEGKIPFSEFASQYITTDEAKARYQNLKNFYQKYGHFWVASGPFYLERVDFHAHEVVVKAFREYTFKADRWAWLAEPPIPVTSVKVPENVVPGLEAKFELTLAYKDQPYPNERMEFVKFLVLDSSGNVLVYGDATSGEEGKWIITLNGSETAKLTPGAYKMMTIALSKDVAVPGIDETPFIVIPQINYFQALLSKTESTLNAKISSLEAALSSSEEKISKLEGTISSLQSMLMASIAVAIVGILIALYAVFTARKQSK